MAKLNIIGGGGSSNADTVDTFHASATPTANTLLPLDASVKFPFSVLSEVVRLSTAADQNIQTGFINIAGDISAYYDTYRIGLRCGSGTKSSIITSSPTVWIEGPAAENKNLVVYQLRVLQSIKSNDNYQLRLGEGDSEILAFASFCPDSGGVGVRQLGNADRPFGSLCLGRTDALPTAAAGYRGEMRIIQGGAGVADQLYVCRKTASDTYVWTQITT